MKKIFTIESTLDEDGDQTAALMPYIQGQHWKLAMWDLDQWFRSKIKYEDVETISTEDARAQIYVILDEYGLKLHD